MYFHITLIFILLSPYIRSLKIIGISIIFFGLNFTTISSRILKPSPFKSLKFFFFINEQEKLEQKQLDDAATVSFARDVIQQKSITPEN